MELTKPKTLNLGECRSIQEGKAKRQVASLRTSEFKRGPHMCNHDSQPKIWKPCFPCSFGSGNKNPNQKAYKIPKGTTLEGPDKSETSDPQPDCADFWLIIGIPKNSIRTTCNDPEPPPPNPTPQTTERYQTLYSYTTKPTTTKTYVHDFRNYAPSRHTSPLPSVV